MYCKYRQGVNLILLHMPYSVRYKIEQIMRGGCQLAAYRRTLIQHLFPSSGHVYSIIFSTLERIEVIQYQLDGWCSLYLYLDTILVNKIVRFDVHTFYNCRNYIWAENCLFTEITPRTFYSLKFWSLDHIKTYVVTTFHLKDFNLPKTCFNLTKYFIL